MSTLVLRRLTITATADCLRTVCWKALVLFGSCVVGCSNEKSLMTATTVSGNTIVEALEKFHNDHGRYPDALTELVPNYLPEIPPPVWGLRKWKYVGNGNDFDIRVDESIHTGDGNALWLRYLGKKSGWQTGD